MTKYSNLRMHTRVPNDGSLSLKYSNEAGEARVIRDQVRENYDQGNHTGKIIIIMKRRSIWVCIESISEKSKQENRVETTYIYSILGFHNKYRLR